MTASLLRMLLSIILLSVCCASAGGADLPTSSRPGFEDYDQFLDELSSVTAIADTAERAQRLDEFWSRLSDHGQIPFIDGERVAFLYRGPAQKVEVAGDFNGWDPSAGPARRLVPSEVWIYETRFPLDARLDYKFVINGGDWRLDAGNPVQQMGGFGPNSELRMPESMASPWVERHDGALRGSLQGPRVIHSEKLGYDLRFAVYLPHGYEEMDELPSIYVTDGHEYARDDMGSMVVVLDELISGRKLRPIVAVFVDPRVDGKNLRHEQYVMSSSFSNFVAEELLPLVDRDYKTSNLREDRAILGTSLGGLNAAWFGIHQSESFGLLAIQSPAFQAGGGRILELYRDSPRLDLRIFMSWGTYYDFGASSEAMLRILNDKGYELNTEVRNEGHSWGQWRALLDELLLYFWGVE